jgi:murein DD-endopeptidase MepM/ murein hydrolase activator NlpD
MKNKFISLIVVPHHGGRQKTISLTKKSIKTILGIVSAAVVILCVIIVDYITMDVTRRKHRNLLEELDNQKLTITEYKSTINRLEANIEYFDNYARKLNVMAGLKFPEALKEVGGLGNGPDNGNISSQDAVLPKDKDPGQLQDIGQRADQVERNLNSLLNFFEQDSQRLASTPSIWPTKGYWSSAYGYRDDPFTGKWTMHWGIDIATSPGNPVWATADGTVISCKADRIGGRTIKINHRGLFTTVYCHLSKYMVKAGQKVKRGQVIGLVGRTGKAKGPHVHYEVRANGKRVNPINYVLED